MAGNVTVPAQRAWSALYPPPPPALRDVEGLGYYIDKAFSVVDPELRRQSEAMAAPFNHFMEQVARMSDEFLAVGDRQAGECAVNWLTHWAEGGAMLGKMRRINNDQPYYTRKWTFDGISVAYLKLRPLVRPDQADVIIAWFRALSRATLDYWKTPGLRHNNHYYWTGVGPLATAVATGDQPLLAAAEAIYREALGHITAEGALPLEMQRGALAFHYHNFALQPLVMMAELARSLGLDWYGGRLDTLALRVAEGFADSSWFARRAGVAQRRLHQPVWVPFLARHTAHPAAFARLVADGPYASALMGGNTSLMAANGVFDPVSEPPRDRPPSPPGRSEAARRRRWR